AQTRSAGWPAFAGHDSCCFEGENHMSAQRGKDLLVKIGDGGSPETFTTVAGLRATTLSFNAQTVDVTNADSVDQWRELLAGAGVKSASFSGSGVFKDAASDESLRAA